MLTTRRACGRTAIVLVALLLGSARVTAAQTRPRRDAGAPSNLLACPISQKPARNGARPDPELIAMLVRCAKGEKPVAANDEGAVGVEVLSVQISEPRPWSYRQDTGNGTPNTIVYPVKVSYTTRTYYWAATEVSEGWIRVLNCFVNGFGEWQIGSEESVRAGSFKRIARN